MAVHLSEHFTYQKLFKAVMPSICMMVFTSIYSIVDGLFVSNFVGTTAFAAVNFVMPVIMALGAIGFMFGAGGSALVAKTLGEGNREQANKIFSMVVYFNLLVGVMLSIAGNFLIEPVAKAMGATPEMLPDCALYGRILVGVVFIFMTQNIFQSFFIVAEKPMLGFLITLLAGVVNMILDATLVAGLHLGLLGAALATAISYGVGGVVPVIYFARNNQSLLRLVKTKFDFKAIGQSCLNGSSELLSNISASVVGVLFNMQLLKFAGENGVAAYGVIMYASFIFAAIFFGYCIGIAPIIGYHYGAENHQELKNLLKKSLLIVCVAGLVMTGLTESLARPLASIFVGYDATLLQMTTVGMRLFSLSFLVCGINFFTSSFFTALNNGLISAVISFARTLVFQITCVLVLPVFFGLNGIWLSMIGAELLATGVSVICILTQKRRYHY